jgi:hypothetical protein
MDTVARVRHHDQAAIALARERGDSAFHLRGVGRRCQAGAHAERFCGGFRGARELHVRRDLHMSRISTR